MLTPECNTNTPLIQNRVSYCIYKLSVPQVVIHTCRKREFAGRNMQHYEIIKIYLTNPNIVFLVPEVPNTKPKIIRSGICCSWYLTC